MKDSVQFLLWKHTNKSSLKIQRHQLYRYLQPTTAATNSRNQLGKPKPALMASWLIRRSHTSPISPINILHWHTEDPHCHFHHGLQCGSNVGPCTVTGTIGVPSCYFDDFISQSYELINWDIAISTEANLDLWNEQDLSSYCMTSTTLYNTWTNIPT
jgi:hypothetical protein